MPRNAKLDLAKRQAMGVFHQVARRSVGTMYDLEKSKRIRDHKGEPTPIIGPRGRLDVRPTESAKPCYSEPRPAPVTTASVAVKVLPAGRYVNHNHKRGQATPQARAHMASFAFKTANRAIPKSYQDRTLTIGGHTFTQTLTIKEPTGCWSIDTESRLIPAKR